MKTAEKTIKEIKEKLKNRQLITGEEVDRLVEFIEAHINKRGRKKLYNETEVLRKYAQMKKKGMSDLKIAKELGISYMHLWRILNGKNS